MRLLAAVLLVATLCPSRKAAAEERYFALFFAHQTDRYQPEQAHTYVHYIKAFMQPDGFPVVLERSTISWLPCNADVRLYALKPEPGKNFSLDETLALGLGKHILAWGPYEMTPYAYGLAMAKIAQLQSGRVLYRATDVTLGFNERSANCIHAAAEIDPDSPRIGQYNVKFGDRATRQVIRAYVQRGFLCNPCVPREDVWSQLGLDGYPIDRRNDWQPNGIVKVLRPKLRCD
jgi:hypothetical protein